MASEHDEECLPPAEFILSTIQQGNYDHNRHNVSRTNAGDFGAANPAHEGVHCLNCLRYVGSVLCIRCITEKTSLLEKQRALKCLRNQRTRLYEEYFKRWNSEKEDRSNGQLLASAFESKHELECNRNRISTLIRLKREVVNQRTESLNRLRSERSQRIKTVAKLRSLVDFTRKGSYSTTRGVFLATLDRRRRDLATVRQRLVSDILSNIFPLDAVSSIASANLGSTASGSSSMDDFEGVAGITDILTDATLTTFLHDRWIFMGNASDVQYRLVRSCLVPDHGDYSMLKGYLFNEPTPSGRIAVADVVAYSPPVTTLDNAAPNRAALGALSALAYCAQLVNVVARILDVRLPFCLSFSDFFIDKLKEAELDTAIVKLNANVAFLCCTQRMDYECICFERPFWNLCNLSKNVKELGYQSYFTVDARVARGFANAEKRITWLERATATIVEATDDWETIDEQVPEWTGTPSSPPTLTQLWTSATTSVANLFKMHN